MVKPLYAIALIGLLYTFYFDGLKPYFNALSETHRLITIAGIPLEKSARSKYREKTIEALHSQCQFGTVQSDAYTVRCASNATFSMFK